MAALASLWALRKRRPVFVIVALGGLGFFLVYPFVDLWLQSRDIAATYQYFDFGVYGGAVERWKTGVSLYQQNADGGYHGSYLYPPFVVLVFWPFVELFAHPEGAIVWGAFSVALLWIGLQLIVGALGLKLHLLERLVLLWVLLGFQPLLISLKLGQMAGFQGGLLSLALAAMLWNTPADERASATANPKSTRIASGALTAIVGLIKLPYATAGAHLLADRDRFAGAIVTGVVLLITTVVGFGVDSVLAYLEVLQWGAVSDPQTRPPSLWLPPYFRPLQGIPAKSLVRYGAVIAIATGALLAGADGERESFALGAVGIPLLAPVTYTYYLVAALPAVVLLLAIELEREDGHPVLPILGAVLVGGHAHGLWFVVTVLPEWVPSITALQPFYWAQPGVWGVLLLFALAARRLVGEISRPEWFT